MGRNRSSYLTLVAARAPSDTTPVATFPPTPVELTSAGSDGPHIVGTSCTNLENDRASDRRIPFVARDDDVEHTAHAAAAAAGSGLQYVDDNSKNSDIERFNSLFGVSG